jgi:hypothetical protein
VVGKEFQGIKGEGHYFKKCEKGKQAFKIIETCLEMLKSSEHEK